MPETAVHSVDWEQIDTVLVDMDGTLLDLAFDNFFWLELVPARYAATNGLEHDEAVRQLSARFDAAAGTLSWYCLDHWTRDLGLDLLSLKRAHRHMIRFLPRAPEFLAAVRARGKRVLIVTNAHRDTLAVKAEQTGIDRLVDGVVCSHDLRTPKEHPDFWDELQQRVPFDRRRALLVEDSLPVLAAAHAHGIARSVAVRRPDSGRPARTVAGFASVEGVAELI